MALAFRCGLSPREFWRLTPFQTIAISKAAADMAREDMKQGMTIAWLTAVLYRAKDIPTLDELLPKTEEEEILQERMRLMEFMRGMKNG